MQHPFEYFGTLTPNATTAEEVLDTARLSGWNLRLAPISARDGDVDLPTPESLAVVRDNPVTGAPELLGVVGTRYKLTPHESLLPLLEALQNSSGGVWHAAGELHGGARSFVALRLPGHMCVGADRLVVDLAVVVSHDGSLPVSLMVVPSRVSDNVVVNPTVSGLEPIFRVLPQPSAELSADQRAMAAMDRAYDYIDALERTARTLLDQTAEPVLISHMLRASLLRQARITPATPSATATRQERRADDIVARLHDAEQKPVAGTGWSALMAAFAWHDEEHPVRVGDGGAEAAQAARVERALFTPRGKTELLDAVQSMVI